MSIYAWQGPRDMFRYLNVYVYTSDNNQNKLFGLCGNYTNGTSTNVYTYDNNLQYEVPSTVNLQGSIMTGGECCRNC